MTEVDENIHEVAQGSDESSNGVAQGKDESNEEVVWVPDESNVKAVGGKKVPLMGVIFGVLFVLFVIVIGSLEILARKGIHVFVEFTRSG